MISCFYFSRCENQSQQSQEKKKDDYIIKTKTRTFDAVVTGAKKDEAAKFKCNVTLRLA
jgi:hypothetical protein